MGVDQNGRDTKFPDAGPDAGGGMAPAKKTPAKKKASGKA
jgi:hypothetical protein